MTTITMTPGFYWHVHHNKLFEWCYDYAERRDYIRESKPQYERETRLRLFQPVRGEVPAAFVQAGTAFHQARTAYVQAVKDAAPYMEALHAAECLNCPWDGQQLVFEKVNN